MKRWALLVVGLYAFILADVLVGALLIAFAPESFKGVSQVIPDLFSPSANKTPYWIFAACVGGWVLLAGLAEAALLVVPVRVAGGRPVGRRHVFWTLAAAIAMLLLLVAGMLITVGETLGNTEGLKEGDGWWAWWLLALAMILLWTPWLFLFGFYVGNRDPQTMMSRLCKWLIAGSILELLIAIPAHTLARMRNYCCAGFGTFWGLAAGLTVMLFAFGPAVFVLFARRVKSLKSNSPPPQNAA
jgi:hypothetical protein